MDVAFLKRIIELLDEAEVPHMLVGSLASTFHGEPRMTRAIDLVVDPCEESIKRFAEALEGSGLYADDPASALHPRDMCNVIDVETGWRAALIMKKDRPFSREEFARRRPTAIGGVELFVATAEDTVLATLEWRKDSQSEQQFRDVVGVLGSQQVDHQYLRRWAAKLGVSDALRDALTAAEA